MAGSRERCARAKSKGAALLSGMVLQAPMREPAPFPRHTQAKEVQARCEAVVHAPNPGPSTSRWARPLCSLYSGCGASQPPAAAQLTDPQLTQAVQEGPGGPLLTTQHSALSHGPDPPWIRRHRHRKICVSAMADPGFTKTVFVKPAAIAGIGVPMPVST